jgi:general secretion pathway protein K
MRYSASPIAARLAAARCDGEDGFILVAVLWILGGLAALAAVYALYVINSASALRIDNDRIEANAAASSALEMTAYYLTGQKADKRATGGHFTFRVGGHAVTVVFRSEAARIDLNLADKPLLAGLFTTLGADDDAAKLYADRIIGWRTGGSGAGNQDKEVTAYRNAGLRYDPRQAPFTSVQELWLVLGIPPALVERALPFVTVYSGQAGIDAADAAPEVLAALPGMTPERLNEVLVQRAALTNPKALGQLLGPAQGGTTTQAGSTFRVDAEINMRGRRMRAEAVILLMDDAPDPYRVLSWADDFDG